MRIQRIGIWSAGKLFALLGGLGGLVAGLLTALNYYYLVGHFPPVTTWNQLDWSVQLSSGPFSVLTLPIVWAVGGLVAGSFFASVYNVTARWFGGLQVEIGHDARLFSADFD